MLQYDVKTVGIKSSFLIQTIPIYKNTPLSWAGSPSRAISACVQSNNGNATLQPTAAQPPHIGLFRLLFLGFVLGFEIFYCSAA